MYNEDKKERLSATDIIENLSTRYYKLEIERLKQELADIRNGRDEDDFDSRKMRSSASKEERIENLERRIKNYENEIKEIASVLHEIRESARKLDKIAKKNGLMSCLYSHLGECLSSRDEKYNLIPTDLYNEIFKHKLFEKGKSKFRRLYSKESHELDVSHTQISREMYRELKQIKDKVVVHTDEHSRYYDDLYWLDYSSLKSELKENQHYDLRDLPAQYYSELASNYYAHYDDEKLRAMGVDVYQLQKARDIAHGKKLEYSDAEEIVESLDYLSSHYNVYNRFRTYGILSNEMEELRDLTRQTAILDAIIDAYDNTEIKDTEMFLYLKEILRKQNKKMQDLTSKTMERYKKAGIKEYIELEEKLRVLYQRLSGLSRQLADAELRHDSNEISRLRALVDATKSEMFGIVYKYPELNKPEYGIDLSKYDKKSKKVENSYDDQEVVPTRVVLDGELEPAPQQYPDYSEEEVSHEQYVETPENLTEVNTAYYGRYMLEKMKGSELGKKTYSEYLEVVAPELEDLIRVERNKEQRAANVFKLYVQYLAAQEDKENAMGFSQFAEYRHGISKDDLPFEYTDEEVKKRLR